MIAAPLRLCITFTRDTKHIYKYFFVGAEISYGYKKNANNFYDYIRFELGSAMSCAISIETHESGHFRFTLC